MLNKPFVFIYRVVFTRNVYVTFWHTSSAIVLIFLSVETPFRCFRICWYECAYLRSLVSVLCYIKGTHSYPILSCVYPRVCWVITDENGNAVGFTGIIGTLLESMCIDVELKALRAAFILAGDKKSTVYYIFYVRVRQGDKATGDILSTICTLGMMS